MTQHLKKFALVVLTFVCFGLNAKDLSASAQLTNLLSTYRQSTGIKAKLEKSFYQEYSDKTEKSSGEIFLLKGRLKIKISNPEESQSLLVVNSKAIWLETPFGEGFPSAVTKLPLRNFKRSEGVWNLIVGESSITQAFKVKKIDKPNSTEFELTPKNDGSYELSKAHLEFSGDKLSKLSYWDQMDNRVSYNFSEWKKNQFSMNEFEYSPPKGATVTEL